MHLKQSHIFYPFFCPQWHYYFWPQATLKGENIIFLSKNSLLLNHQLTCLARVRLNRCVFFCSFCMKSLTLIYYLAIFNAYCDRMETVYNIKRLLFIQNLNDIQDICLNGIWYVIPKYLNSIVLNSKQKEVKNIRLHSDTSIKWRWYKRLSFSFLHVFYIERIGFVCTI